MMVGEFDFYEVVAILVSLLCMIVFFVMYFPLPYVIVYSPTGVMHILLSFIKYPNSKYTPPPPHAVLPGGMAKSRFLSFIKREN